MRPARDLSALGGARCRFASQGAWPGARAAMLAARFGSAALPGAPLPSPPARKSVAQLARSAPCAGAGQAHRDAGPPAPV